ncbi:hypothetical protein HanPSC8_Chr15g0682961 [Helianthus annuus]|nr:hypothetical protein HanPSC8_Chr15g0682961 [Helianthus annuus]
MGFWCIKGLGESTCFMKGPARSAFFTRLTLVIESLTTSLISGVGADHSRCFLCRFGDVGSEGS